MKRYKPLVDKMYYIILVTSLIPIAALTVVSAFSPISLIVTLPVDLLVIYFLISPLFGYVELRDDTLYIKYGLIMEKEIPYAKIRGTVKARKFYSDSMVSLKNAMEHVNVRYNSFDIASVSVIDNDGFIRELEARRAARHTDASKPL